MKTGSVKDLLVGTLVGIVSMLPGASGATVAVIFGIYERLIGDIADIRGRLVHDLGFVFVVGTGIVIGLMVCAFGLDFLIERVEIPMMFFFVALIVTQVPDIVKLGDDGAPATGWNLLAFAAGLAVMVALLFVDEGGSDGGEGLGLPAMVAVGAILAVSKIAPGISGSTVLLALGLYTPFMHALTDLDIVTLAPVGAGFVVGALLFSKVVDHFMRNNRKSAYAAILGLTVGSIVTVTVDAAGGLTGSDIMVQSAVAVIAGLALGIVLSRVAGRYAEETLSG